MIPSLREALYWHCYAQMLEDKGRWDEAQRKYLTGIAAKSEPLAKLQQAYEDFL